MAECLKLDKIHVVNTMVIHWEIRILRQAVTFETLYLRAQMEFGGVVGIKINLFCTCYKLRNTAKTWNVSIMSNSSPSLFLCKKSQSAPNTGTNFLSVHYSFKGLVSTSKPQNMSAELHLVFEISNNYHEFTMTFIGSPDLIAM